MLRAGPFSDERIVGLANRRFVSFYFDLSDRGVAGDPEARKFVTRKATHLSGQRVPTPEILFMTADGEIKGSVSNYASSEKVLAKMMQVLRDNPQLARPSHGEEQLEDPVARARLQIDLQNHEGAAKLLAKVERDEARYLLGRLARLRKDWNAMERSLGKVKSAGLADDVRMERAYKLWYAGRFKELKKHLDEFPRTSNRYTEARYYEGLACYHGGDKEGAVAIWKKTVKGCSQDPWIYRADWAFCNSKQSGSRRSFSSAGARTSLLNRIGYMGRRNPDLEAPGKQSRKRL